MRYAEDGVDVTYRRIAEDSARRVVPVPALEADGWRAAFRGGAREGQE